jgi:hypothetical protein
MYMANEPATAPMEAIDRMIHVLRGHRVMLDTDLARIYGVPLKRLNEQVKRNADRFPPDFAFQLTRQEFAALRSQFATSKGRGGRRHLPWVFTEHGALMLASVLNSPVAVEASVRVVRAFVRLRELLATNKQLARRFAAIEDRVETHDEALQALFTAIRQLLEPLEDSKSRREIGFHAGHPVEESPARPVPVPKNR